MGVEPHLVAHILAEDGSFTSIPLQASEAHGDISPSFQLHMFHNCGFCQCRSSIRIGCTITPKKKGYFSQKTRLTQDDFLNWSTPSHSTLKLALWKDDKGKNLNPTTSTLVFSWAGTINASIYLCTVSPSKALLHSAYCITFLRGLLLSTQGSTIAPLWGLH